MPPGFEEIGEGNEDLRAEGDFGTGGALDQGGELGDEGGDKEDADADAGEGEEGGVDEGEDELGLQFLDGLEVVGLAAEDGIERAGGFAGGGEAAVELVKAGAGAAEGGGEVHAIAHVLADALGYGFEVAEFLAVLHGEQRGLELEAAAEHVGEFFGEHDDVGFFHFQQAVGVGVFGLVFALGVGGFRGGGGAGLGGFLFGYGASEFFEGDGLETFFVKEAHGLGAVCGIEFALADGALFVDGFVGEGGHG